MGGDVGLDEQGDPLGVEAAGQELRGLLDGGFLELVGVPRQRDRVEVDDAVEGIVLVLGGDPVSDGPEVVADVGISGGLDAAEGPLP